MTSVFLVDDHRIFLTGVRAELEDAELFWIPLVGGEHGIALGDEVEPHRGGLVAKADTPKPAKPTTKTTTKTSTKTTPTAKDKKADKTKKRERVTNDRV